MIITTHILAGLLLWKYFGTCFWALFIGAVIIDIDHVILFFTKGIYNPITMLDHSAKCYKYGNHRTFVHSLLGIAIIVAVVAVLDLEFASFFAIGAVSHLLLDLFDGNGVVQWFWPKKKEYNGFFRTNIITQFIVTTLLICIVVVWLL